MDLAIKQFREEREERIIAAADEFTVPGVGICSLELVAMTSVFCRFPVRGPELVLVKAISSESTCSGDKDQATAPPVAYGWGGNLEAGPFSAVGILNLWMGPPDRTIGVVTKPQREAAVCPGTPLTFSFPRATQQNTLTLDFQDFQMADYRYDPRINYWR